MFSHFNLGLNFLIIVQTTKTILLYSGNNDGRMKKLLKSRTDLHVYLRTFHGTMIFKLTTYLLSYKIFMEELKLGK